MTITAHEIAGHRIKLREGRCYFAARIIALKRFTVFPVLFMDETEQTVRGVVNGLTYHQAQNLMIEFNREWTGKVW